MLPYRSAPEFEKTMKNLSVVLERGRAWWAVRRTAEKTVIIAVVGTFGAATVATGSAIQGFLLTLVLLAVLAAIGALVRNQLGFRHGRNPTLLVERAADRLDGLFRGRGGRDRIPNIAVVVFNSADLRALEAQVGLDEVAAELTDHYRTLARRHVAIAADSDAPLEIFVEADPEQPSGRCEIRDFDSYLPAAPRHGAAIPPPTRSFAPGHDGVPALRLTTDGRVVKTTASRATVGRSARADLQIVEDDLSVSRIHAVFTYGDGDWWMARCGANPILVNGVALTGWQVVRDSDLITWSDVPEPLESQVRLS
ncbi:FHA domain-containing protein [Nocardia sp. NPDC057353]|uniref:FHA domain-containing protein n=1 Tax=Nocardia sp. NPDC057353 TaxID=3346104 RepID=UPI003644DE7E